uniref:Uncharacterized protein n=1 Tax=Panthera leo TaxID=9689 RepID=A0A8C8XRG3_PANLE
MRRSWNALCRQGLPYRLYRPSPGLLSPSSVWATSGPRSQLFWPLKGWLSIQAPRWPLLVSLSTRACAGPEVIWSLVQAKSLGGQTS